MKRIEGDDCETHLTDLKTRSDIIVTKYTLCPYKIC